MNASFFEKYKVKLDEGHALGVMHEQLCKAKKAYKENKDSDQYLKFLVGLRDQIDDFFESKELDIDQYS